jgi:hypothetical protein
MRNLYFTILIALLIGACAQPITPTRFKDAIVECSQDKITPAVKADAIACLTGAVAGQWMQCLELLPYSVEMIVCTVAELSRDSAKAINDQSAYPVDHVILERANEFLKTNKISRK